MSEFSFPNHPSHPSHPKSGLVTGINDEPSASLPIELLPCPPGSGGSGRLAEDQTAGPGGNGNG